MIPVRTQNQNKKMIEESSSIFIESNTEKMNHHSKI